jgi:ketosteroid isomerase-like protein
MSAIEWREKQGDENRRIDSVEQRGDHVLVAVSWSDEHGRRHRWAHALKLRDGRIVDIQDYASPARAAAATRLRAVFS